MTRAEARNPTLELAIVAARDDRRAWAVYADWLLGQGDPLGERINLSLAESLAAGESLDPLDPFDRLDPLDTASLPIVAEPGVALGWQHGLLARLRWTHPRSEVEAIDRFAALLTSSAARLLSTIEIAVDDHEDYDVAPLLGRLAASGPLPALRELIVRDFDVLDHSSSFVGIGDLSPVLLACPNLRTLHVRGAAIRFGKPLQHAQLERLCLEGDALSRSSFATIVAATLPQLRSLELWLGTRWIGSATTRELLERLGAGHGLPRLEQLGLRNSEVSDDIVEAMPRWPLLGRLRELDLSMGTLGDHGGRAILANLARFAGLQRLDLDHNYLSTELAAALEAGLGERVRIGRRLVDEHPEHA